MTLPPLPEVFGDASALNSVLSVLFEPSDVLSNQLVPQLAVLPSSISQAVKSYPNLIDLALFVISSWDASSKAAFIAGHPRIGEVKNLSSLSQQEQAANATPPEVLTCLEFLNVFYEHKYPGLVYVTFVNGRSRAEIKDEMQIKLGIDDNTDIQDPAIIEQIIPIKAGDVEWTAELERAISDIGAIAKSRLKTLDMA